MTDESIDIYYSKYYRKIKHEDIGPEELYKRQSSTSELALSFARSLLKPKAKILDYAGAGGRMAAFHKAGFDTSGFDLDKDYIDYGYKMGLRPYDSKEKYDLIFLSHVLEHINEPVGFLKSVIAPIIGANSLLYVELPLLNTAKERMPSQHFFGDFHLAHKYYFTRESLALLFSMAGSTIVKQDKDMFLCKKSAETTEVPSSKEMLAISNLLIQEAVQIKNQAVLKNFLYANLKKYLPTPVKSVGKYALRKLGLFER